MSRNGNWDRYWRRACQLYATSTFPIMHLIPPPQKILHKHCFPFLLGRLLYPGEMKNIGYAKFGVGANRVLYGKCGSGVLAIIFLTVQSKSSRSLCED